MDGLFGVLGVFFWVGLGVAACWWEALVRWGSERKRSKVLISGEKVGGTRFGVSVGKCRIPGNPFRR